MPFGLKNIGATYQQAMIAIFHDIMYQELEDYVDNMVVKSRGKEENFHVLKRVFERCRTFKLRTPLSVHLEYPLGNSWAFWLIAEE